MTDTPLSAWCAIALVLAIFVWGFRRTFKRKRSWQDWYHAVYLKSAHWQRTRQRRLEMDNYTCQDCGEHGNQVHHKNYKRLWRERMSDLISLCDCCHGRRHGKQR